MKWLLCSLCLIVPLSAVELESSSVVVDAQSCYYDGNAIQLQGEVVLEHDLGVVSAETAVLSRTVTDDASHFSLLHLDGTIHLLLDSGGSFHCTQAELDFGKLTGNFFGDAQHHVTYTDIIDEEGKTIVLRGKHMRIIMNQLELEDDLPLTHQVQEIFADDQVTVDYDRMFMAAGDHLLYRRYLQLKGAEGVPMPGLIFLRPKKFQGTCQVTSHLGDMIKAAEIAIDLPKQRVDFTDPRGAVHFAGPDGARRRLDFSAAALDWDNKENILTLQEEVTLYQNELGKLTSDRVQVCHEPGKGLKELQWIQAEGKTVMTYDDLLHNDTHRLVCYGKVNIDAAQCVTTLSSPLDAEGKVASDKQLSFSDKRGSVYADIARLDYHLEDTHLVPHKLTLLNQVKLVNRTADGQTVTGPALQYALADVVEYLPAKEQMFLQAVEGGRVLVYDRMNNVQVSAPGVKIRRDGTTGKEAIEGIGDVRFSFAETERTKLIEQFADEESTE